jgi:hypothetical protein
MRAPSTGNWQQTESELRRRLSEAEVRLAEQERTLERLRTDKDFVARLSPPKAALRQTGRGDLFRFED